MPWFRGAANGSTYMRTEFIGRWIAGGFCGMSDDEAFALLGEVMAEVGKPWPRYTSAEIMRMQYEQYMYYKPQNNHYGPNLGLYVDGLTPRI